MGYYKVRCRNCGSTNININDDTESKLIDCLECGITDEFNDVNLWTEWVEEEQVQQEN